MAGKKTSSNKYRSVDPNDYYSYEDRFQEGGKGGGGGKAPTKRGPKTFDDMKRQQHRAARDQRLEELEDALYNILDGFPDFENPVQEEEFLAQYAAWVMENLAHLTPPDPAQLEISFSKSGGPGGQNVNKRETRVGLLHRPTQIRVVNDQTRSQGENRELAVKLLTQRLQDHLRDWKMYLSPGQVVDPPLIKELLDRDL